MKGQQMKKIITTLLSTLIVSVTVAGIVWAVQPLKTSTPAVSSAVENGESVAKSASGSVALPKPLDRDAAKATVAAAFGLPKAYAKKVDPQGIRLSEINDKFEELEIQVLEGKPVDHKSGEFSFVDPVNRCPHQYYEQVVDGVYYAGYLTRTQISANGTLYRGTLRGYSVDFMKAEIRKHK